MSKRERGGEGERERGRVGEKRQTEIQRLRALVTSRLMVYFVTMVCTVLFYKLMGNTCTPVADSC